MRGGSRERRTVRSDDAERRRRVSRSGLGPPSRGSLRRADRRHHDLPGDSARSTRACWEGDASGRSTCGSTTCGTGRTDRHRTVDDEAFGGGPGMVLKPEPSFAAVESLDPDRGRVLLMSPAGRRLDQALVRELASEPHLTILCGRYEGVRRAGGRRPARRGGLDRRLRASRAVSCPALVLIEAVTRLVPGRASATRRRTSRTRSASRGSSTTRTTRGPQEFRGMRVPDVLLSGDHAAIDDGDARRPQRRPRATDPDSAEGSSTALSGTATAVHAGGQRAAGTLADRCHEQDRSDRAAVPAHGPPGFPPR